MLKKFFLYIFFLTTVVYIKGQVLNTSPFSRYGIGEINTIQSAHYFGFGNITSPSSEPQYININNPRHFVIIQKFKSISNFQKYILIINFTIIFIFRIIKYYV